MKAVRFRVTGVVQGVGFRAWTHGTASHLGLHGWVRNTPDGAVEGHVQGDEATVDQLLLALKEGPRASRVRSVEFVDAQGEASDGFHVRR